MASPAMKANAPTKETARAPAPAPAQAPAAAGQAPAGGPQAAGAAPQTPLSKEVILSQINASLPTYDEGANFLAEKWTLEKVTDVQLKDKVRDPAALYAQVIATWRVRLGGNDAAFVKAFGAQDPNAVGKLGQLDREQNVENGGSQTAVMAYYTTVATALAATKKARNEISSVLKAAASGYVKKGAKIGESQLVNLGKRRVTLTALYRSAKAGDVDARLTSWATEQIAKQANLTTKQVQAANVVLDDAAKMEAMKELLKTSDAGKAQSYLDPAKTLVQAQAWYAGDEVQMTPAGNGTIFTDWMLANARAPEPSADGSIAVTFLPTPLKEVRKPTAFDGMDNPTWSPAAVPANTFGALDGAPRLFVQTSIPFGQVLSATATVAASGWAAQLTRLAALIPPAAKPEAKKADAAAAPVVAQAPVPREEPHAQPTAGTPGSNAPAVPSKPKATPGAPGSPLAPPAAAVAKPPVVPAAPTGAGAKPAGSAPGAPAPGGAPVAAPAAAPPKPAAAPPAAAAAPVAGPAGAKPPVAAPAAPAAAPVPAAAAPVPAAPPVVAPPVAVAVPVSGGAPVVGAPVVADKDVEITIIKKDLATAASAGGLGAFTEVEATPWAKALAPTGTIKQSALTAASADAKLKLVDAWAKAEAANPVGFCKAYAGPDAIATRKFGELDGEVDSNYETGGAGPKALFYKQLATALGAGTVPRANVFGVCDTAVRAAGLRMKGAHIAQSQLQPMLHRTAGVGATFFRTTNGLAVAKDAVDDPASTLTPALRALGEAAVLKDHAEVVKQYWISKGGQYAKSKLVGNLTPRDGGTWFSSGAVSLTPGGGDTQFKQLMEIGALQPEWFPDGACKFSIDAAAAAAVAGSCVKPTCLDGMQSGLFVPNNSPNHFGVTGGGFNEFLASAIPASAVVTMEIISTSGGLQQAIKDADKAAKDAGHSSAMDGMERDKAKGQATPGAAAAQPVYDSVGAMTAKERTTPTPVDAKGQRVTPPVAAPVAAPAPAGAPVAGPAPAAKPPAAAPVAAPAPAAAPAVGAAPAAKPPAAAPVAAPAPAAAPAVGAAPAAKPPAAAPVAAPAPAAAPVAGAAPAAKPPASAPVAAPAPAAAPVAGAAPAAKPPAAASGAAPAPAGAPVAGAAPAAKPLAAAPVAAPAPAGAPVAAPAPGGAPVVGAAPAAKPDVPAGDVSKHAAGPAPAGWEAQVVKQVPAESVQSDDAGHTYHALKDGRVVATSVASLVSPDVAAKVTTAPAASPDPAAQVQARKQEIAGVATPPIAQAQGEPLVTLDVNAKAVTDVKSDSPDPILLKNKLVSQTNAYLALVDPKPADKQVALDAIKATFEQLRAAMKAARGESSKLVQLRVQFESFLGVKAMGWPQGTACVDAMVGNAKAMIAEQEAPAAADGADMDKRLAGLTPKQKEAIGKAIGTDVNIGFAGVVGKNFDDILKVLDSGSLVQKAQGLMGFTDGYLVPGLLKGSGAIFQRAKANLAIVQPEIDLLKLLEDANKLNDKKKARALLLTSPKFRSDIENYEREAATHNAERAVENGGPLNPDAVLKGMDTKIPQQPIEVCTEQQMDFVAGQAKASDYPTFNLADYQLKRGKEAKAAYLIGAGIRTTKPTGAAVDATSTVEGKDGITVETIGAMEQGNYAYIEGKMENIVDPRHTWIMAANDAGAPLKAGISGTTARFVGAANLLGGEKNGATVAMLGHLQAIEAHSFWEIVDAAGLGMAAGKYVPFAPNDAGMRAAAGEFIGQNGYAALGPMDKADAGKVLLGEKAAT